MTQLITALGPLGMLLFGMSIGALGAAFLFVADKHYHRRQARARQLTRREQRQQWLNTLLDEEP